MPSRPRRALVVAAAALGSSLSLASASPPSPTAAHPLRSLAAHPLRSLAAHPLRSLAAPRPPAPAAGALELIPTTAESLRVRGLHRYLGTLRIEPAPDGLVIENALSLERYLLGLNEVPTDWPMEALRAQAVAARTYTRWTLAQGRAGAAATYGFDICASELCQVFSGADVLRTEDGARWARAVRSTAGKVLVYDGRPILARYHSTSGGATLDNSEAFPGEASFPYLRAVQSTTEKASPFYRWRVSFTLERLQRILESAGWWSAADGTLGAVRSVPSARGLHYPDVVLKGGERLRRSAEELREVLRDHAPRLFPSLYPGPAPTSTGRLPETLPSNRIEVSTRAGRVKILGRGWGHGVGMSQWGAHGLARAGAGHGEILTHYYPGTELATRPEPGLVEVGLAWARPSVAVFGSFRIVRAGGGLLVPRALGTWTFTAESSGRITLAPPEGWGRPLAIELVRAPRRVRAGERAPVTVTLTSPARVAVATVGEGVVAPARTRDAGTRRVSWVAPPSAGTYRVRVEASDGGARRATEGVRIRVLAAPEGGAPDIEEAGGGPLPWIAAAVLLGLVSLGAASFAGTMRR
jgi:SpoIID/LytB domain protein